MNRPGAHHTRRGGPLATTVALATVVLLVLSPIPWPAVHAASAKSAAEFQLTGASQPSQLSGWWQLPIQGPSPQNRTAGSLAYDPPIGRAVLFGGCPDGYAGYGGCGLNSLNGTWEYSHGGWSNVTGAVAPSARSLAVMAFDPAVGGVVLFGGRNWSGWLDDTWLFSNGSWAELHPASRPPAVEEAGMAYDTTDSELVLFGGIPNGSIVATNQTWVFKDDTWMNATGATHPPAWSSPYLAPDPENGGVLCFGGSTVEIGPTNGAFTWTFVHGSWTDLSSAIGANNPTFRYGVVGGYDPQLNESLLFGGLGGLFQLEHDGWAYTSSGAWTNLSTIREPYPGAFYYTQATWDGADGYMVDFSEVDLVSGGGVTVPVARTATWALLTDIVPELLLALPATVRTGQAFDVNSTAAGGLPPYTFRWAFGDGSNASGAESTHSYGSAGVFTVTLNVTDSVGQWKTLERTVTVLGRPSNGSGLPFGLSATQLSEAAAGIGAIALVMAVVMFRRRHRRPRSTERSKSTSPRG